MDFSDKIIIAKSLSFLLQERYLSEFEVIDGINQHKDGLNFYDWLYKNELISKSDYDEICENLKAQDDESII